MRVAIYARVSTLLGQDSSIQIDSVKSKLQSHDKEDMQIYIDEGISGLNERRPALDQMIKDARKQKFDILAVYSIDRLGRSTKHLLCLIDELAQYGVSLISVRENLDFTTPMGKMALTMISAVAELEVSITKERIKVALAMRKLAAQKSGSGWRCGRPSISEDLRKQVLELRDKGLSYKRISTQLGGVSKSSVERIIKQNTK